MHAWYSPGTNVSTHNACAHVPQFIEKKAKGSDAIFKFAPVLYLPLWGTLFFGIGALSSLSSLSSLPARRDTAGLPGCSGLPALGRGFGRG